MSAPPLPERLPDGRLLVPMRAEGPGGVIGDGLVAIGPDHPDFQAWERLLDRPGAAEHKQGPPHAGGGPCRKGQMP